MLNLDVHPGTSLGPFSLFSSMRSTIALLRTNRAVQHVDFVYSSDDPLSSEYCLHLPSDGLVIRCEPRTQKVVRVDVFSMSKCRLSYAGRAFSGGALPCTLASVYELFGPTYPGHMDKADGTYTLSYPGLEICFSIPEAFRDSFSGDLELPDGTTPRAVTLAILPRPESQLQFPPQSYPSRASLPPQSQQPPHSRTSSNLNSSSNSSSSSNSNSESAVLELVMFHGLRELPFGSSVEDVLCVLGPPCEIFEKGHDKLRIHSKGHETFSDDYIYNYNERGLDIVFDASQHKVSKLVVHTNFPMHPTFHKYAKCHFRLGLQGGVITADSRWDQVQQLFGEDGGRPLVHGATLSNNPFGGTRFYAFDGVIFEVMRNGHLASVTLFEVPQSQCL